jgi:hypothetical protein
MFDGRLMVPLFADDGEGMLLRNSSLPLIMVTRFRR